MAGDLPVRYCGGDGVGDGTKTSPARGEGHPHGHKGPNLLPYYQGLHNGHPCGGSSRCSRRHRYRYPFVLQRQTTLTESTSYLYGWLAGYFAADGTVSKKGELFLDSAEEANIAHAQAVCQLLGIKTSDPYIIPATGRR